MTATPIAAMSVGGAIHLAEAAQAVPCLVREGIIDRAAAIALLAIAADQACAPDGVGACGQGEIARRAGTSQPYLASACLPQLEEAGLVIRRRHNGRHAYFPDHERIRAAAGGDL